MLAFQAADIYQVQAFRGHEKQYMRLASAWSVVFLIAISVSYLCQGRRPILPRLARQLLRHRPGHADRISARACSCSCAAGHAKAGSTAAPSWSAPSDNGESLIGSLATQRDSDVRVIGVFDDRGDERSSATCNGIPKLGTVDELVEFARRTRVDLVIFSLPISAEGRILQMLKKLWVLPVDIRLAAHSNKLQFRPRSYSYIGSVPVLDIFDRPIADWDVVMKWLFDKIVGSLVLICVAPVMLLIALAIKLDSKGPILFKQRRYGFNNELIEVYKFRSMYVEHTDATREQARHQERSARHPRRPFHPQDQPRRVAAAFQRRIHRRPVAGRPAPACRARQAEDRLYDEAVDGYFARHRVKPGITGWAQINGWRGETDSQEKIQRRVEHDLYYIENWSIMFDFYIVARTPFALLRGENAY